MILQEIRQLAKEKDVRIVSGMKKADLIRAVQGAEGNYECFSTATDGFCDREDCIWRADCLPAK